MRGDMKQMAFSTNFSAPIMLILAVLFGTALVVVIMVVFAAGIGNSSVSTAVVSTNTTLTNLLPWLGAMVAGGFVMVAIGGRRR